MKKSYLYTGFAMAAVGVAFMLIAIFTEHALEPLLWGLCFGLLFNGIVSVLKYWYWTRPAHQEKYAQILKKERISARDERKIMLRDKSGAVTYRISLLLCALGAFGFSIASILGTSWARYVTITLGVLLIVLYVLGIWVYRRLEKRL